MPLYEEKLISPFALRFTQEHIKTIFKDGRVVEDSVNEIVAKPGKEDYDIILNAPFPHIEIARWHPKGPDRDGEHWFTLDNRRLYCLQKAAAAHWPKTVGVVVQILYDDAGGVWKKYDSSTYGRSVSIANRLRDKELERWDWYKQVVASSLGNQLARVAKVTIADDDKATVDELLDTPEEGSSLMALARAMASKPKAIDSDSEQLGAEESDSATPSSPSLDVSAMETLARRWGKKLNKGILSVQTSGCRTPSTATDDTDADTAEAEDSTSDRDEDVGKSVASVGGYEGYEGLDAYGACEAGGYYGYGGVDACSGYGGYGAYGYGAYGMAAQMQHFQAQQAAAMRYHMVMAQKARALTAIATKQKMLQAQYAQLQGNTTGCRSKKRGNK